MIYCNKCGAQCDDNSSFCNICGAQLHNSQNASEQSEATAYPDRKGQKIQAILIDKNEKPLAVLGTSYLASFLTTGSIKDTFAVLTDRRYYVKGTVFSGQGNDIERCEEETVINLEDITGVRMVHKSSVWLYFLMFAMPVVFIAYMLFWSTDATKEICTFILAWGSTIASYFLFKKTLLCVCYAGGCIGINIYAYGKETSHKFMCNIVKAKDNARYNAGYNIEN